MSFKIVPAVKQLINEYFNIDSDIGLIEPKQNTSIAIETTTEKLTEKITEKLTEKITKKSIQTSILYSKFITNYNIINKKYNLNYKLELNIDSIITRQNQLIGAFNLTKLIEIGLFKQLFILYDETNNNIIILSSLELNKFMIYNNYDIFDRIHLISIIDKTIYGKNIELNDKIKAIIIIAKQLINETIQLYRNIYSIQIEEKLNIYKNDYMLTLKDKIFINKNLELFDQLNSSLQVKISYLSTDTQRYNNYKN